MTMMYVMMIIIIINYFHKKEDETPHQAQKKGRKQRADRHKEGNANSLA